MQRLFRFTLSGAAAGIITGIIGGGGGLFLVPLLTYFCKIPPSEVLPLSVSIMFPICLTLAFSNFNLNIFTLALPYLIGGALGGLIGHHLSDRIPVVWLHRALGCFLLWGGIQYLC